MLTVFICTVLSALCFCNSADFILSPLSDSMLAKHEFVAYTEKCAIKLYCTCVLKITGVECRTKTKNSFFSVQ